MVFTASAVAVEKFAPKIYATALRLGLELTSLRQGHTGAGGEVVRRVHCKCPRAGDEEQEPLENPGNEKEEVFSSLWCL